MSFDTTAKNWEVFRHIFLLLPSLLTSHFNMIWRIKALLFLASLELEKQSQQNSSSSTCALSLLTYLLGFNNKYLKLIQSWKHLVRFVFIDFWNNWDIKWDMTTVSEIHVFNMEIKNKIRKTKLIISNKTAIKLRRFTTLYRKNHKCRINFCP